jgi:hypothetical protein
MTRRADSGVTASGAPRLALWTPYGSGIQDGHPGNRYRLLSFRRRLAETGNWY